jgi:uncharacterized membrane protein YcaP (DUF421 family)
MGLDVGTMLLPPIPWLEKVLRPVIVYAAIVVIMHLAGKRELAQVNTFDLVVLLLISNVVQNATIGEDSSILGGLVGAVALVATNYMVVRFLFRHAKLDRLLQSEPTFLIREGQILHENLDRELITEDELLAALRRQGVAEASEVEQAILETSGAISVIQKRPTSAEQLHAELLSRLDNLTREVRELRRAGGALS